MAALQSFVGAYRGFKARRWLRSDIDYIHFVLAAIHSRYESYEESKEGIVVGKRPNENQVEPSAWSKGILPSNKRKFKPHTEPWYGILRTKSVEADMGNGPFNWGRLKWPEETREVESVDVSEVRARLQNFADDGVRILGIVVSPEEVETVREQFKGFVGWRIAVIPYEKPFRSKAVAFRGRIETFIERDKGWVAGERVANRTAKKVVEALESTNEPEHFVYPHEIDLLEEFLDAYTDEDPVDVHPREWVQIDLDYMDWLLAQIKAREKRFALEKQVKRGTPVIHSFETLTSQALLIIGLAVHHGNSKVTARFSTANLNEEDLVQFAKRYFRKQSGTLDVGRIRNRLKRKVGGESDLEDLLPPLEGRGSKPFRDALTVITQAIRALANPAQTRFTKRVWDWLESFVPKYKYFKFVHTARAETLFSIVFEWVVYWGMGYLLLPFLAVGGFYNVLVGGVLITVLQLVRFIRAHDNNDPSVRDFAKWIALIYGGGALAPFLLPGGWGITAFGLSLLMGLLNHYLFDVNKIYARRLSREFNFISKKGSSLNFQPTNSQEVEKQDLPPSSLDFLEGLLRGRASVQVDAKGNLNHPLLAIDSANGSASDSEEEDRFQQQKDPSLASFSERETEKSQFMTIDEAVEVLLKISSLSSMSKRNIRLSAIFAREISSYPIENAVVSGSSLSDLVWRTSNFFSWALSPCALAISRFDFLRLNFERTFSRFFADCK